MSRYTPTQPGHPAEHSRLLGRYSGSEPRVFHGYSSQASPRQGPPVPSHSPYLETSGRPGLLGYNPGHTGQEQYEEYQQHGQSLSEYPEEIERDDFRNVYSRSSSRPVASEVPGIQSPYPRQVDRKPPYLAEREREQEDFNEYHDEWAGGRTQPSQHSDRYHKGNLDPPMKDSNEPYQRSHPSLLGDYIEQQPDDLQRSHPEEPWSRRGVHDHAAGRRKEISRFLEPTPFRESRDEHYDGHGGGQAAVDTGYHGTEQPSYQPKGVPPPSPSQSGRWQTGAQKQLTSSVYCDVCNISFPTINLFQVHSTGMLHRKKCQNRKRPAEQMRQSQPPHDSTNKPEERSNQVADSNTPANYCKICLSDVNRNSEVIWSKHCESFEHRKKFLQLLSEMGPEAFKKQFPDEHFGDSKDFIKVVSLCKTAYEQYAMRCGILNRLTCRLCWSNTKSMNAWMVHLAGQKHQEETWAVLSDIGDLAYRKRYSDVPATCHKVLFGSLKPLWPVYTQEHGSMVVKSETRPLIHDELAGKKMRKEEEPPLAEKHWQSGQKVPDPQIIQGLMQQILLKQMQGEDVSDIQKKLKETITASQRSSPQDQLQNPKKDVQEKPDGQDKNLQQQVQMEQRLATNQMTIEQMRKQMTSMMETIQKLSQRHLESDVGHHSTDNIQTVDMDIEAEAEPNSADYQKPLDYPELQKEQQEQQRDMTVREMWMAEKAPFFTTDMGTDQMTKPGRRLEPGSGNGDRTENSSSSRYSETELSQFTGMMRESHSDYNQRVLDLNRKRIASADQTSDQLRRMPTAYSKYESINSPNWSSDPASKRDNDGDYSDSRRPRHTNKRDERSRRSRFEPSGLDQAVPSLLNLPKKQKSPLDSTTVQKPQTTFLPNKPLANMAVADVVAARARAQLAVDKIINSSTSKQQASNVVGSSRAAILGHPASTAVVMGQSGISGQQALVGQPLVLPQSGVVGQPGFMGQAAVRAPVNLPGKGSGLAGAVEHVGPYQMRGPYREIESTPEILQGRGVGTPSQTLGPFPKMGANEGVKQSCMIDGAINGPMGNTMEGLLLKAQQMTGIHDSGAVMEAMQMLQSMDSQVFGGLSKLTPDILQGLLVNASDLSALAQTAGQLSTLDPQVLDMFMAVTPRM